MAAVQFSGGIGPGQGQALTAAVPAAHQRLTVRPVGMAGGLGQTGRTGGRHGMVARFARQRHQTRIDPPLAKKAAQHLVAVVLQQAAGRRKTLAGMVRTGARAVGTEKKDALAAYALPQAQAAAAISAMVFFPSQKVEWV